MQQHEGCPAARKVADVQAAAIARNSVFDEGRGFRPLGIGHDLAPFARGLFSGRIEMLRMRPSMRSTPAPSWPKATKVSVRVADPEKRMVSPNHSLTMVPLPNM